MVSENSNLMPVALDAGKLASYAQQRLIAINVNPI